MIADQLLAIDNGTQSVRALLFDLKGTLLAKSRVVLPEYLTPAPGMIEQQPQVFWDAVCEACQELWKMPGVRKEAIAGIAITTQRSTVINLDSKGEPLRPAITWMDQRRTGGLPPIGGFWGLAFALSGMSETVAHLQAEAESNWLQKHQPEVWAKTSKYVFLSGFLTQKMTGRLVDSVGSQVGYVPFDYKKKAWSGKFDWKWKAVPIDPVLLPDLIQPGEQLGVVSHEAALQTGIPEDLPVIATAADKACEIIGAGCLEPHMACVSYGTTATINTTHKKYVEIIPLIPPYPSAVPDAYSMEFQIFRGYWMVSWFKRDLAGMKKGSKTARN